MFPALNRQQNAISHPSIEVSFRYGSCVRQTQLFINVNLPCHWLIRGKSTCITINGNFADKKDNVILATG